MLKMNFSKYVYNIGLPVFLVAQLAACGGGIDDDSNSLAQPASSESRAQPASSEFMSILEPSKAVDVGLMSSYIEPKLPASSYSENIAPDSISTAASAKKRCVTIYVADFKNLDVGDVLEDVKLSYFKGEREILRAWNDDGDNMITNPLYWWQTAPGYDTQKDSIVTSTNVYLDTSDENARTMNFKLFKTVKKSDPCVLTTPTKTAMTAIHPDSISSSVTVMGKLFAVGAVGFITRYGVSAVLHSTLESAGINSFDGGWNQNGINGVSSCAGAAAMVILEAYFDGELLSRDDWVKAGMVACVGAALNAAPYKEFTKFLEDHKAAITADFGPWFRSANTLIGNTPPRNSLTQMMTLLRATFKESVEAAV
jgi:hypothetical protein